MKARSSLSNITLSIVVYVLVTALCLTIVLPVMQIITISLSPASVANKAGLHLIPTKIDFSAYETIFRSSEGLWNAYKNTIIRTIIGTTLTVFMTFLGAYPISKRDLPFNKAITAFIFVTMFISGGLIPMYIQIRNLNLMNNFLALILPGAVNTFLLLVTRNFIAELPDSLEESAKIDGANDMQILWRIILPLSKPILATVALYTAVFHWNAWFDSMIYTPKQDMQVLQLYLRGILISGNDAAQEMTTGVTNYVSTEALKMATLVISIIPIVLAYPRLQKYFVKGVLVGSVKG